MRQVLSWRFVAALGALVGLALLVNLVFVDRGSIARLAVPAEPVSRRADVIGLVLETQTQGFAVANGRSEGDLTMSLAPPYDQPMRIFPGTAGSNDCPGLGQFGQCALLAELLGDTIVSFALVPMGPSFTFELPAIEALDGGRAFLANGWQVPYAPVIDREACDSPAESFSEFIRLVGPAHRSLYALGDAAIVAVLCN